MTEQLLLESTKIARAIFANLYPADDSRGVMIREGRADDTIEVCTIAQAVRMAADHPLPEANPRLRARRLLGDAYARANITRGGCPMMRSAIPAVRNGDWDDLPPVQAIQRTLSGEVA